METTREIALRTYKDATKYGMIDTPMNWHIWKRAFDTAERELKNLQLGAVSGSVCDECTDGSGWYGDEDIVYNCSKCNPKAI